MRQVAELFDVITKLAGQLLSALALTIVFAVVVAVMGVLGIGFTLVVGVAMTGIWVCNTLIKTASR